VARTDVPPVPAGSPGPGLLTGLRVLDFSLWRPGPYATQLLAELGAEVLKVEPPGGDPMRAFPALFASLHANKKSVVLDLKDPADRARALELCAQADVVVEGYRPGVAARLGIDAATVRAAHPGVVYCSVSGFGQDGPLAGAAGHDVNYQALAGTLAPAGGPPADPPLPLADLAAGLTAAFAICAATLRQRATGEGETIDLAMADVLATWTGAASTRPAAATAASDAVPGYGVYATADGGHLALGVVSEDHFWRALCGELALPDAAGLTFAERLGDGAALDRAVAAAVAARPLAELVNALTAAGVPASPVLDRTGMLALPHFRARGVVTADPWADPASGYPVRFASRPARRTSAPPALDAHRGQGFAAR
jgi:crotonobetainyl-CoA:carnitine CoA-transferase CaiB-like acyl-CoA transferase